MAGTTAVTRLSRDIASTPRPFRQWSAIRRNPVALGATFIIVCFFALALTAPLLPLRDPEVIETSQRLSSPAIMSGALLGTDELGRDMLSRLIWGSRISLMMGVGAALAALIVGSVLGLISGFWGKVLDQVIMRLMDTLMAFPFILLAIALVAALGPGLFNAMLAISVVGVPLYARVVRASTLVVREQEYVLAARACGARNSRLLVWHVIPNTLGRP